MGIPCLTVRDSTERPITVSEGTNGLVGINPNGIRRAASDILTGRAKRGRVPHLWDGHAASHRPSSGPHSEHTHFSLTCRTTRPPSQSKAESLADPLPYLLLPARLHRLLYPLARRS